MSRVTRIGLLFAAALALVASACGSSNTPKQGVSPGTGAAAGKTIKIALLMSGPVNDGGHNNLAYKALQQLDTQGDKTAYTESVTPADQMSVTEQYASQGYDLIIGHGFEWGTVFEQVAPKYPNVKFFVTGDPPSQEPPPSNVGFLNGSYSEFGYGVGALAALMSGSHVVGAVGGADIPVQREILNAYKLGAGKTVPGTQGLDVITGDFNDAAKGREAATAMIGNGADVIWHAADVTGLGALQAAGSANIKAIGAYADQESVAPQSVGTSFELGSEYEVLTVADAVRNNDSSFPWGQAWKPPLNKIWFPIWKDSDHNPSIISDQVWQQWLTTWNDLTAGKITVPANTQ